MYGSQGKMEEGETGTLGLTRRTITYKMCVLVTPLLLFATPWTVAHQALLSMEFTTQEY